MENFLASKHTRIEKVYNSNAFNLEAQDIREFNKKVSIQTTSRSETLNHFIPRKSESNMSENANDNFKEILKELRNKEGDELVNEFERIFKRRIPNDIADLNEAKKNRDFERINLKTHFLSSSLVTLNFTYGLALSNEVVQAIKLGNNLSALALTKKFIDYLQNALNEM